MINGEKYRDKLLKFIEEKNAGSFTFSKGKEGKFWQCGGRYCSECGMSKERSNCSVERLKWLLSEYKEPTKVTRLEYELLKFLNAQGYKYIARDSLTNLYLYTSKPTKDKKVWKTNRQYLGIGLLYALFQFVKWEDSEPISIEDVLNNCEVFE